jgi:Tfp pilus assembly protein PilF
MLSVTIINALIGLANLAGFICFVVVIIKLFKAEGALKGIFGIICSIYAFIWGWMNHSRFKLNKWMWGWTASILFAIVLLVASFVVFGSMASSMFSEYAKTGQTPSIGGIRPPAQRTARKRISKKRITPTKAPAATPGAEKPEFDFEMEMRKVNNLIKLSEKNADAYFNRGWLHEFNGDLEAAEKDYDKAIALDKRHADALYNRGLIRAKKEKYDLAILDFSEILKLMPRSVDALNNRGSAYFKTGKPDLAIKDYDAALKINPNDADLYYNRAVVYLSKGDKATADEDFKKAAKMGQNQAREYLGMKPVKKTNEAPRVSSGKG